MSCWSPPRKSLAGPFEPSASPGPPLGPHGGDPSAAIGLVAGWGRYPVVVARALQGLGYRVVCLGIKDHADQPLRQMCQVYHEVGLAKLGGAIRYFRQHGVGQATMAGKIHKVVLFQRLAWLKHVPDWHCIRTFYPHFVTRSKDRKDDTLLGAVVEAFARAGITFAPATDFAPELLVKFGQLSGRRLTAAQCKDIQFGWQLAKELGRLDVGQSVAVKGQAALALEAIEGTDQCICRAGQLCPQGGFTVVKVAKPQQDMRFDVPTIGLQTIHTLIQNRAAVLAVEAGKTILLDQPEVIRLANQHRLTLVAIEPQRMGELTELAES